MSAKITAEDFRHMPADRNLQKVRSLRCSLLRTEAHANRGPADRFACPLACEAFTHLFGPKALEIARIPVRQMAHAVPAIMVCTAQVIEIKASLNLH
jgi:hypothetical protein